MGVDRGSIQSLVADYSETKGRDLGDAFVSRARDNAPRKTGTLAESIQADDPVVGSGSVTVHVSVGEEYGSFQNTGTGIYGPTGQRIVPVSSPVLVFEADGGTVFARSVAGSPATHWWDNTIEQWGSIVADAA